MDSFLSCEKSYTKLFELAEADCDIKIISIPVPVPVPVLVSVGNGAVGREYEAVGVTDEITDGTCAVKVLPIK